MNGAQSNPTRPPIDPSTLEIGPIAARVARGLFTRYLGVFAALAGLMVTATVVPSRVVHHAAPVDVGGAAAGGPTRTGDSGASQSAVTSDAPTASGVAVPAAPALGGTATAGDVPLAPSKPPTASGGQALPTVPDENPCPVAALGPKPEISHGVAAILLGAASPSLSALGPFSADAVPALGLVSPLLPVIAPLADKGGPYMTPLFPIFIQLSQLATAAWDGPLNSLQPTLIQFNQQSIVPYELALLSALEPVPTALNDSAVVPCSQVLTGQVAKLIPPPPGA